MPTDFFSGTDGNNVLFTLLGALLGSITSVIIEYIKKKTKKEHKIEEYESINESSERSVKTAHMVSTMLEERLLGERKYFDDGLIRSKEDCQKQIANMKTQYDSEIKVMQEDLLLKEKEICSLRDLVSQLTEEKTQQEK
jgi:hypothetical protein